MPFTLQKDKKYFYFYCLAIYMALSAFLAEHFNQFITDNDAFLYLSIAKKYASGHFYEAVNDYWSPLLSWLLTPLLLLKIDPIVSIRIIQFLIGGFALFGFLKASSGFKLSGGLKLSSPLIAIILIAYFSVEETPDVLFAGVVLWYFYFIVKDDFLPGKQSTLLTGLWGAILFFTKAIGLYIFLLHITFCAMYWLVRNRKRRIEIAKKYLVTILVFAVISGTWIAVMSFKYHTFTISDAGKYNFAVVGPKNISLQGIKAPLKHPINDGIYQLPDKFSLNYWERPQVSTESMQWNPLASKSDFNFFLHLIEENLFRLYYDVLFRLIMALWIISILLYIIFKGKNSLLNYKTLFLIALAVMIVIPYLCIFSMPRYMLPVDLLFLISAVNNFNAVMDAGNVVKGSIVIIISIAIINLGRYWLINYKQYNKSEKEFHLAYNDISKIQFMENSGAIISVQSGYDAMLKTSLISYFTNNPYIGQIAEDSLQQERSYSLLRAQGKYLFTWSSSNNEDALFKNLNAVFLDSTSHLRIFDVTHHKWKLRS
jgi:hypothetical protein